MHSVNANLGYCEGKPNIFAIFDIIIMHNSQAVYGIWLKIELDNFITVTNQIW